MMIEDRMSRPRATLSVERRAELNRFWPTLQPLRVLADRWGCSEAYVSTQAKRIGLPSRHLRMAEIRVASRYIQKTCSAYLVAEAAKRGITDEALAAELIRVIIKDRLVGAILDDESKRAA